MPIGNVRPRHFATASDFRRWLEEQHGTARELWVGFYKRDSGKGGITYPQALDEALCFGWIDGVRRNLTPESYTIRFTPRRPKSVWSRVNLGHFKRLKRLGRVHAAGLQAYAERDLAKSGLSMKDLPSRLSADEERRFKSERAAWQFFQKQPPSYQRVVCRWVAGANRRETRARRLTQLIRDSVAHRRLAIMGGKRPGTDRTA